MRLRGLELFRVAQAVFLFQEVFMEFLPGGYTLVLSPDAFPLSTDSIALAGFARLGRAARVLDLGSGCGTLGLLLCSTHADCHVTGIELQPEAHAAALENIRRNGLNQRMESICADLRDVSLTPGSFSCCISNPPYFSGGPSGSLPQARHEGCCTLRELFAAADRALKFGGDFFLVHKPERLAELCARGAEFRLEPKRLCLLRHRPESEISLILLQCRKGARPGLSWEQWCLFDAQGNPTEQYRKLYHIQHI